MKTDVSRRSIVTFVAFITGISAIGVAKLAFVKPISTQHWLKQFNKELWTSSFPSYSTKPNLRNLFMKKLTRDRVAPITSTGVSCLNCLNDIHHAREIIG